jgi:DNA-binding IscR family transcriptional regulator
MTKNTRKSKTPAQINAALRAWENAIAEYLDWISEAEILSDANRNYQARDAYENASSELCKLLIQHKVYRQLSTP